MLTRADGTTRSHECKLRKMKRVHDAIFSLPLIRPRGTDPWNEVEVKFKYVCMSYYHISK